MTASTEDLKGTAGLESARPHNEIVDHVWQGLLDKDDRTSPAEYPDMCLITRDELSSIIAESMADAAFQASRAIPASASEGDGATTAERLAWALDRLEDCGTKVAFTLGMRRSMQDCRDHISALSAAPVGVGGGLSDHPMINVPAETFALLFAYCHISQLDVPEAVRKHPDYPGNRGGRLGHLTRTLRPYADKAFAALAKLPTPKEPSL